MKSWFKMQIKAGAKDTAEIMIYEEIGFWGKTAKDFKLELDSLGEIKNIDLRICSPGGNVSMGFAIYNLLRQHSANVETYIDGLAYSMASVIAMAGDKIHIASNAYVGIHNPWGGMIGEAKDFRRQADLLDGMKEWSIEAYLQHAILSREELVEKMDVETILNAKDCVQFGFAHDIYDAVEIAASIDPEKYPNIPKTIFNKSNKSQNNQKENSMDEKAYKDKIANLESQLKEKEDQPKITDFQTLADTEGYDFAKENFGKSDAEIAKAKVDRENAELKAKNQELEEKLAKKDDGAQAAGFSHGEGKQQDDPKNKKDKETFMDKVKHFQKEESMSLTDAMLKAQEEFPELHAKFVGKNYKD